MESPSILVSCCLRAESIFFLIGYKWLRSEHLVQSRLVRLLLLNLLRLICLFTLKVSQHQLPECHQLLHLLLGNLIAHLNRLHLAASAHGHRAKLGKHGLCTVKLFALEADCTQCAQRGIERGLRPFLVVVEVPGGAGAVAWERAAKLCVEIAHRVRQSLAALNDLRELA